MPAGIWEDRSQSEGSNEEEPIQRRTDRMDLEGSHTRMPCPRSSNARCIRTTYLWLPQVCRWDGRGRGQIDEAPDPRGRTFEETVRGAKLGDCGDQVDCRQNGERTRASDRGLLRDRAGQTVTTCLCADADLPIKLELCADPAAKTGPWCGGDSPTVRTISALRFAAYTRVSQA